MKTTILVTLLASIIATVAQAGIKKTTFICSLKADPTARAIHFDLEEGTNPLITKAASIYMDSTSNYPYTPNMYYVAFRPFRLDFQYSTEFGGENLLRFESINDSEKLDSYGVKSFEASAKEIGDESLNVYVCERI